MRPRVVVVTGTGTEIGKTHLSRALLLRWGGTASCCGIKPIESGVQGLEGDDGRLLRESSVFHVKPEMPAPYALRLPLSPHLAARDAGRSIDMERVTAWIKEVVDGAEGVLIELAGGLFTPLGPALVNADLVRAIQPAATILVAPDRLGVLHDVIATTRAAAASGLEIHAIAISAPALADASTGTNASELRLLNTIPVFGPIPRSPPDHLADTPEVADLLDAVLSVPMRG